MSWRLWDKRIRAEDRKGAQDLRTNKMRAVVYQGKGAVSLEERDIPVIRDPGDAIVKVTLTTICSSDIHIKHGAVPKAVPGTILGTSLSDRWWKQEAR